MFSVIPNSVYGGILSFFDPNTGAYTFSPYSNYTGEGGFTYEYYCDGELMDTATVTVFISDSCDICSEISILKQMLIKVTEELRIIKCEITKR